MRSASATCQPATGLPLDPERPVHTLTVGERQRVEIVRCLLQDPRILIMDEPTSVLAPPAVADLFATLRAVASRGVGILYISHKLEEIRTLCDRATVLRAGRVTGRCDPRQETVESLAQMMIGRALPHPRHAPASPGPVVLDIDGLALPAVDRFGVALQAVTLSVHAGEIVGIAGISGNGQREFVAAITGERTVPAGGGRHDCRRSGRHARRRWAPRTGHGLCPGGADGARCGARAVAVRQCTADGAPPGAGRTRLHPPPPCARFRRRRHRCVRRQGCGNRGRRRIAVGRQPAEIHRGPRDPARRPRVFVAAHPTWGVDVGAAAQIRQALVDLRDQGAAVLVISDDIDELFEICDRIAVMAQGRLSSPMPAAGTSAEAVGLLMSGADSTRASVAAC